MTTHRRHSWRGQASAPVYAATDEVVEVVNAGDQPIAFVADFRVVRMEAGQHANLPTRLAHYLDTLSGALRLATDPTRLTWDENTFTWRPCAPETDPEPTAPRS
jgi:hypothetical protein